MPFSTTSATSASATFFRTGTSPFYARLKIRLWREDAYRSELVQYIHLNPIRAKIVKDIDALAENGSKIR